MPPPPPPPPLSPPSCSPPPPPPCSTPPPPNRRSRLVLVLLLAVAVAGVAAPARAAAREPLTNLAHLEFLGDRVDPPAQAGHTTWRMEQEPEIGVLWTYAEPQPDGTYRRLGGGTYDPATGTWGQGAFNADDMTRAAVVYLRHWRQFGDQASRDRAYQLLRGVTFLGRASTGSPRSARARPTPGGQGRQGGPQGDLQDLRGCRRRRQHQAGAVRAGKKLGVSGRSRMQVRAGRGHRQEAVANRRSGHLGARKRQAQPTARRGARARDAVAGAGRAAREPGRGVPRAGGPR